MGGGEVRQSGAQPIAVGERGSDVLGVHGVRGIAPSTLDSGGIAMTPFGRPPSLQVRGAVDHDAMDPGAHVRLTAERSFAGEGSDDGVLHCVLGVGIVVRQRPGEANEADEAFLQARAERVLGEDLRHSDRPASLVRAGASKEGVERKTPAPAQGGAVAMAFIQFMSGPIGRGGRVVLGVVLLVLGIAAAGGVGGIVLVVVGAVMALLGLSNICILGPLFGCPLQGSKLSQAGHAGTAARGR